MTPYGLGLYAVVKYGEFVGEHPNVAAAARDGSTPLSAQVAQAKYLKPEAATTVSTAAKGAARILQTKAQEQKPQGTIYKVPGSATKSGKPYIGRHNKPNPQKTRKSKDGRDRTKAEVIDNYDASKPAQGQVKEQEAIDNNGGVQNLDNKRNEVNPERMKELKKDN